MTYTYTCESCHKETEVRCAMKDMERTITCPFCNSVARKNIETPALVGLSSNNARIKRQMAERNEDAGRRMRYSHKSVRAVSGNE